MAITNTGNPMTPTSAPNAVPLVPAYAGSGGVLISQESLGGSNYRTGSNLTNTRLYDVQGVYLVKRLRLTSCTSNGGTPSTGAVYYGRAGFGPEFSEDVAPLALVARPNTTSGGNAAVAPWMEAVQGKWIDLYNVWFRPATANDGVLWECEK